MQPGRNYSFVSVHVVNLEKGGEVLPDHYPQ